MQQVSLAQYVGLLRRYFWTQRLAVSGLFVLIVLDNGLLLIGPRLLATFVDMLTAQAEIAQLTWVGVWYIANAVLQQGVHLVTVYYGELTGWRAANRLRNDLASHVLHLDMSYHKLQTPGIMIERIDGDVASLNRFFSQMVLQIGGSVLLLVATIVVLTYQEWRLGLLMTVFAVIAVLVLMRIRDVAVPHWEANREAVAQLFGFVEERLAGIEDIRGLGAGRHVLQRLDALNAARARSETRGRMYGSLTWVVPMFLLAMMTIMILGYGWVLYRDDRITLGVLVMTLFYAEMIMRPIRTLASEIDQLQQASAGILRIAELERVQSRLQDGTQHLDMQQIPQVELDAVTFRYPDADGHEAPVLDAVSLQIGAGQTIGLLGRTGSGTSTLIRLLFRLYDVTSGQIRLNGRPIHEYRIAELRQYVGLVTQDVQLFYASVRDNLTFFDRSIPDERLLRALQTLGLDAWLARQPQGLDTVLAANGAVSAGEAQLIALARVYLKQPQLVILDEASARIDPETEALVEQALDTVLHGKTTIIIAHRLQTVRRCDVIAILADGVLLETGPEAALRADAHSRYAAMLRQGNMEDYT